ncbi:MAG: TlpA family protein disulfide reductase [Armatimonadota bacterium]|nr:TlpA family protein disulfide reductase [Armatimonadota bacterium]
MRRFLTPLLPALLSLVALSAACAQDAPPLPAGSHAPAFSTRTLAGKPLSLRSLRGKVVLLDFWATWCGPCRMATPTLQSLNRKFGHRGLQVVGLSVDDPSTLAQVKPFIKQEGVTYTMSAVPQANGKAARAYHADAIPSQYLIDQNGIVRWSQAGFSPNEGAELSAMIAKLLAHRR